MLAEFAPRPNAVASLGHLTVMDGGNAENAGAFFRLGFEALGLLPGGPLSAI
jgi:hypothetical protein